MIVLIKATNELMVLLLFLAVAIAVLLAAHYHFRLQPAAVSRSPLRVRLFLLHHVAVV